MNRFQGMVCIVTGGASGIGREIVRYLVTRGAQIMMVDVNQDALDQTVQELQNLPGICRPNIIDVRDKTRMEELVAQTVQEYGRLDLMINNAGIGLDGELIDTSHEQFARVMDINFWGVYYGTMAAYPVMIRQGHGQIVNVSSLAGLLPGGLMASYVASKHAVTGFTLSLRGEAKQYGVKANALCPGFIETELHDTTEIVTEYVHAQAQQRKKTQFPTAAACIPLMMKGIVKNRAIIISPRSHRMYWWINRLVPSFIPWMWSKIIAEICKNPSRQVISGRPTHNLYSPEPTRRCDLQ